MRTAAPAATLLLFAGGAVAEGIPLPSCTNADGSTSVLYGAQDARFVTGLRFGPEGQDGMTMFLQCGSSSGFQIMHGGGMPAVVDAQGRDVTPPSALDIVLAGLNSAAAMTMEDILRRVRAGGFASRAFDPAADCLCDAEMRHALD